MELILCEVLGVYLAVHDHGAAPVVLLKAPDNRYFPIFIGLYEAVSINNVMNGPTPVRPLTHDLFTETLTALGTKLKEVRIDSIEDGVYYATLILGTHLGDISIDCRPSDGIALAVRQNSPIFVDDTILVNSTASKEQLPKLHDFVDYFG